MLFQSKCSLKGLRSVCCSARRQLRQERAVLVLSITERSTFKVLEQFLNFSDSSFSLVTGVVALLIFGSLFETECFCSAALFGSLLFIEFDRYDDVLFHMHCTLFLIYNQLTGENQNKQNIFYNHLFFVEWQLKKCVTFGQMMFSACVSTTMYYLLLFAVSYFDSFSFV